MWDEAMRGAPGIRCLIPFLCLACVPPAFSGEAARGPGLPPELPWSGKSRSLVLPPGDPWVTPAEASGFQRTPRYDETMAWLQKLAAVAPEIRFVSLGRSPEGRDIWMVVASREKAESPQALRA